MTQQHLDQVKAAAGRYICDAISGDRPSKGDFERARDVLVNTIFGSCARPAREINALQPISKLPVDIFVRIASLLPLRALCAAMIVSSGWNAIIGGTPVLWASATVHFSYENCWSAHALRTIGARSGSVPLALHLKWTEGTVGTVDIKDRLCSCQRQLRRLSQRVKVLSITGDFEFWRAALEKPLLKLEMLHVERVYHRINLHFIADAPMLREVHLAYCDLLFPEDIVLPTVHKVYVSGIQIGRSLERYFKIFSQVEEIYLVSARRDVSHPELIPFPVVSSDTLRRVFVSADIGPNLINGVFHGIHDRVISFGQRSTWDSSEQLHANIRMLASLGHPKCLQMGWHTIASEAPAGYELLKIDEWSLYLCVDGRNVAVDIHSYQFNRMLRSWATVSSTQFDLLSVLDIPVNIWHRMMIVGLSVPQLRELKLIIGYMCCWEGDQPEEDGLLRDDDANSNANEGSTHALDMDHFIDSDGEEDPGEENDASGFIANGDEVVSTNRGNEDEVIRCKDGDFSDEVDSNNSTSSSFNGDMNVDKQGRQPSSGYRRLNLPHLSYIPAPRNPLCLEVLRIERSGYAVDEIQSDDLAQFLRKLLKAGHILDRLGLGGGLQLVEPEVDEIRAASGSVTLDYLQVQLPEAARPWYWMPESHSAQG